MGRISYSFRDTEAKVDRRYFTPTCRDNGQLLISHNEYLFSTNSATMCIAIYNNIMTLVGRLVHNSQIACLQLPRNSQIKS